MEGPSTYCDLSLITQKTIDINYFLNKIKNNGYSVLALDNQVSDFKTISNNSASTINKQATTKKSINQQKPVTILKRITLLIQSTINLHPLGQQQAPFQCDIMAIRPLNQKIFHAICTEYDSYDIITFDISNKLPFMLKRNPVYQAIRKGKYFQIFYQPIFDETKRVVAMTNMINIIKATNGKNLIVSSHASDHSTHRTPYDIAALMISLGLDKQKALKSMKQNCHEVIRSGQHRLYLKGAIKQIPVSIGIKLNRRIKKCRQNVKNIQQKLKNDQKIRVQKQKNESMDQQKDK